jgi:predicted transcriptional regulator
MSSETMTIRLPTEVKEKLSRISEATRRSRSYLAAEAVAAFVARELEIIEGIERSLSDADAGRLIGHRDAMAEIGAVIEAAERKRAHAPRRQMGRGRAR